MKTFLMSAARFFLSGVALAASIASFGAVKAQDCPFADDSAIFYYSPSTIGGVGALASVWQTEEFGACFEEATKKVDAELRCRFADEMKEDCFPRENFEYLEDALTKALGEKPNAANLAKAYFERVDGVALAVELDRSSTSEPRPSGGVVDGRKPKAVSLTWILNFDPSGLDLKKLCGDDLEVVKDEGGVYEAKLTVKGDGKSEVVWLGAVKIKDLDKRAVVLADSQATLETKLTRFQASNDFVVKRLSGESVYSELILKPALFEVLSSELAKDERNEKAQTAKSFIDKIKSLRVKSLDVDGTFVATVELEAGDANLAKEFNDLAAGGVALLSLTAAKKELKPEERIALELLKSVEFRSEENSNFATATLKIDAETLRTIAKRAVGKAREKAN